MTVLSGSGEELGGPAETVSSGFERDSFIRSRSSPTFDFFGDPSSCSPGLSSLGSSSRGITRLLLFFVADTGHSTPQLAHLLSPLMLPFVADDPGEGSQRRWAKAVDLLFESAPSFPCAYLLHRSAAGSACGVFKDCCNLCTSKGSLVRLAGSGWEDAGEELFPRFLFRIGVTLGLELEGVALCTHKTSSFAGVSFGWETTLSSGTPIKSDSGNRIAGVEGGKDSLAASTFV